MADEVVSNGQHLATEATLQRLADALTGTGGGSAGVIASADQLAKLARESGVSEQAIAQFRSNVIAAATAVQGLTKTFVNGNPQVGQMFGALGMLGGTIGGVADGFAILAKYQQENLETQRDLAKNGAAFGGALTEVRAAAANSFLTLGEFSNAVAKNKDVLNSLGGSMQAGINKFVAIQNTLLAPGSETQQNLASLGYSAADAAELTGSYMRSQGTMNKSSLKDTATISAGIAEYAQQLDMVTQLTGKSRQEIQAKMDKENTEAQWQSALASMSKDKADKLRQGMQMALAQGGQGAVDAFKAMALGLPPMTEAGRLYMATQHAGVEALKKYNANANDSAVSTKQAAAANRAALAKQISDGRQDREALQKVLQADALAGGKLSESFADATKLQTKFQDMSEDQIAAELEKMNAEEERQKSQAAEMDAANKNLQQLGQAIIGIINPLVKVVMPVFTALGWIASKLAAGLDLIPDVLKPVVGAVALFGTTILIARTKMLTSGGGGGLLGGLFNRGGGGGGPVPTPPGSAALSAAPAAGGGGFIGFIKALGRGLASLAPIAIPMLIGAGAVAGVIALLGVGVATAIALIGLSLPVFAKGLKDIAEIDGVNLLKVAAGVTALGIAMVAFTAGSVIGGLGAIGSKVLNFFSGGGPIGQIKDSVLALSPILPQLVMIGPAINTYADGIVAFGRAVSSVDIAKAEKLKSVLSGPTMAEAMSNAGAQMIQAATKFVTGKGGAEEKTHLELTALNNNVKELSKIMKDIAENTKRTVDATKSLNGNLFA